MITYITSANVASFKELYNIISADQDATISAFATALKTAIDTFATTYYDDAGVYRTLEEQAIMNNATVVDGGVVGIEAIETLPPTAN